VRSMWSGRDGVPLPDVLLEMEPNRVSAVQSHQLELAGVPLLDEAMRCLSI
jgi:hypothetical protein